MKIALLSRSPKIHSTQVLARAARKRGHQVQVIDYLKCHMTLAPGEARIFLGRKELAGYDAVIPRIGANHSFFGTAVVRQLELAGTWCLNGSTAIAMARDKLMCMQMLAARGVPMPATACASAPEATKHLIKSCGGAPVIIKMLEGAQGVGVVLADSPAAAESVIDAFHGLYARTLAQEYIAEAGGADVRAFVVGGEVVAAMQRQARAGEFRSNLHLGGEATAVDISGEERKLALKAARVTGLNVAGVDLIRSSRGPLVLEVNASPGLEGIQAATKVDVGARIIEFIENNAAPGRPPRKR